MMARRHHHHQQHHQQQPLSNPFRAPRNGVNGNRHSHAQQSVQNMFLQACWIIAVGAFLVTALSWAVPQPPAEQPSATNLALLGRRPVIPEQQPIRKGGGVRGQSKLPPKKTTNNQSSPGRAAGQRHQHWDPDTLGHQDEQHEEHDDDEVVNSGEAPKQPHEEDSEDTSDAMAPLLHKAKKRQSGTGPFGREKNEEASTEEKEAHDHDEGESGDYDPNDPDESHKIPPPFVSKRKHLQVNAIDGNSTTAATGNITSTTLSKRPIVLDTGNSSNMTGGDHVTGSEELKTSNNITNLVNSTMRKQPLLDANSTLDVKDDQKRWPKVKLGTNKKSPLKSNGKTTRASVLKKREKTKKRTSSVLGNTKSSLHGTTNSNSTNYDNLSIRMEPSVDSEEADDAKSLVKSSGNTTKTAELKKKGKKSTKKISSINGNSTKPSLHGKKNRMKDSLHAEARDSIKATKDPEKPGTKTKTKKKIRHEIKEVEEGVTVA